MSIMSSIFSAPTRHRFLATFAAAGAFALILLSAFSGAQAEQAAAPPPKPGAAAKAEPATSKGISDVGAGNGHMSGQSFEDCH